MKSKALLIVSLLANAVAVALLVRNFTRHEVRNDLAQHESAAARTDVSRVVRAEETRHEVRSATNREAVHPLASGPLPSVWKQVAAADYQQFAENLRAIGVPEETVRDIVMLDLMKSLGEEMTGLSHRVEKPFWQSRTSGVKSPSVSNEVAQAMTQLADFSKHVLGIEPSDWFAERWGWMESVMSGGESEDFEPVTALLEGVIGQEYGWLPTDRARELQRLIRANEKTQEELQRRIEPLKQGSPECDALQLQLSKIVQDGEKIADNYLTPAEHRERDLRDDGGLQQQLAGVEVTRAEYERLHDLARSNKAAEPPYFRDGTPEAAQALNILGTERFAEFQRCSDSRYVGILEICSASEIPRQDVLKIYEIGLALDQRVAAGGADANELVEQAKQEMKTLVPDPAKREAVANSLNAYFCRH